MVQNQNQGYQPIDESKVNWDQIEEKFGISKEVLERTGAKDNMLNFGKSGLLDVTMLIYDQKVKAAARLQLTRLQDGTYSVLPHFVRKEQKLENAEYMGYTFSKEDAKALKETGNLGKVVPLFNVRDNTMQECFVSYDKQTNELVHYPVSKLHLRESVGNVKFTPEEMELLKQGGIVKDKLFEGENGQKFTVDFQVNADRKNVSFVPSSSRQEVAQEQNQKTKLDWTNEDGSIKNLTKWKGIPLTEEQQKDYREGKSVKLDNYPLKDGTTATMYLMFYPDKNQPFVSKNDPMQGKVVTRCRARSLPQPMRARHRWQSTIRARPTRPPRRWTSHCRRDRWLPRTSTRRSHRSPMAKSRSRRKRKSRSEARNSDPRSAMCGQPTAICGCPPLTRVYINKYKTTESIFTI